MKKTLVITIFFLMIGGCSGVNPTISNHVDRTSLFPGTLTPSSDMEAGKTKDATIIEDKSTSIFQGITKTDQQGQQSISPDTGSNSNDGIKSDNQSSVKEKRVYIGAIGDAPIHLTISTEDDQITGVYYYDKYKTEIPLSGYMYETMKDCPTFILSEATKEKGKLYGIIRKQDYIQGFWKNDDGFYPMYLIREGSDLPIPEKPGDAVMLFDGHWTGVQSSFFAGSKLDIKVLFDDIVYYEFFAHNGAATGGLDGYGVLQGDKWVSIFTDHVNYDESSEHVSFEFQVRDSQLYLNSNQYDYYCGAGVLFDEVYTKEELLIQTPSSNDVGIVFSEKQEELFRNMVGVYYEDFIRYTHGVNYTLVLKDGKYVMAGESYLRGASGCCYYINTTDYLYAALYDFTAIRYFTNDPEYANTLPRHMKEWADRSGMEILYYYYDEPYPFAAEISELLKEQIDNIIKGEEITLPKNYSLLDFCQGDLNQDGQRDIAIIIEQQPGNESGSRAVYIFLKNHMGYDLKHENHTLVLGSKNGGVYGDPYAGISIAEGVLTISDYGGSATRWGHDYSFEYKENELLLAKVISIGHSTHTLNGARDIYDLFRGSTETRTIDQDYREYDNLLIYSGKIKDPKGIRFEDTVAESEYIFEVEPEEPFPSMGAFYIAHGIEMYFKYDADTILDKVQEKYYPDMVKMLYTCDEEILKNYSLLMGFQIPQYYYSDGDMILYYDRIEQGQEAYLHTVRCYSLKDRWSVNKYYYFNDATGTEVSLY